MKNKQFSSAKLIIFLILLACFFSAELRASSFIFPNEVNPIHSKAILEAAPRGAYFSVGTERGFMAAALCPNTDFLVLMDSDADVVLYNQINIALLEASTDRKDYLYLRLNSTFADWTNRTHNMPLSAQTHSVLKNHTAFRFWELSVRNEEFRLFNTSDPNSSWYAGGNYLFQDVLFFKLQRMAKKGRILGLKGDLKSTKDLLDVARRVSSFDLEFSVIDLSNAWWEAYAGPVGIQTILKVFKPVVNLKTILLLTQYESVSHHFGYFGATIEKISLKSDIKAFLNYLRKFELTGVHFTYLTNAEVGQINFHLDDSTFFPTTTGAPVELTGSYVVPRVKRSLWGTINSWCVRLLSR